MTDTTTLEVTTDWTKISDGQCVVQSVNDRKSYAKLLFDLVVSDTKPASDTGAFMEITLSTPANFHRDAPVWLRLNEANADENQQVVVIK